MSSKKRVLVRAIEEHTQSAKAAAMEDHFNAMLEDGYQVQIMELGSERTLFLFGIHSAPPPVPVERPTGNWMSEAELAAYKALSPAAQRLLLHLNAAAASTATSSLPRVLREICKSASPQCVKETSDFIASNPPHSCDEANCPLTQAWGVIATTVKSFVMENMQ